MLEMARYHQRGQALPLGLAFLMGAVLFGITMFDTSQLASEKSRLANTADAAVYSGLIWQARALNFQAYTNRAMVANQVSIGQMVSLASWTQYGDITARNIDNTLGLFFPAKAYTSAAKRAMRQIDDAVVNMVEGFIPVIDSINAVLSASQQSLYLSSFAAMPNIVQEVVSRNDHRYSVNSAYSIVEQGRNLVDWRNLTTQYDDNASLLRKASIINRSKDEFTAGRAVGHSQLLAGLPKINGGIFRAWVEKEGKTNLVAEKVVSSNGFGFSSNQEELEWEWKAKDTFSLHIESFSCGCSWRRGCWCGWGRSEKPIGWGSRYLNGDFECKENEFWGREECTSYMRKNKRAEKFADSENEEIDAEYEGVRAYYDLRDLSQRNQDPRLVLRIEVQLHNNQIRTSSQIDDLGSATLSVSRNGMGQGMFRQEGKMLSNVMTSISSGEVYFHPPDDYRPDRRNGKIEIASLFSPYWDVRLIKTPITERMMAWGLRDVNFLSEGAKGVASQSPELSSFAAQGINKLGQVSFRSYQRELSSGVQRQGESYARQFEEQFVNQITEQIEKGAMNRAISSFGF